MCTGQRVVSLRPLLEYFVVMSYVCPRVTFLPESKMTLFTFYNYVDLPVFHVFP